MSSGAWYSPLLHNTFDGGVLLALPYDALADWDGSGEEAEVVDEVGSFVFRRIGSTLGIFVRDDDGIHEGHWMRFADQPGVLLVVWSAWDDPTRPWLPGDIERVARVWEDRADPRQNWLERRLRHTELSWLHHEPVQSVSSGILLLLHEEGSPSEARIALPRTVARCGQVVPVGITPGEYRIETVVLNEFPEGTNYCLVCKWVRAA